VFQSAGQARKGVLAPLGDGFGIALRWKMKNGEILVAENCFIFFLEGPTPLFLAINRTNDAF
jgi:hypothetical protein